MSATAVSVVRGRLLSGLVLAIIVLGLLGHIVPVPFSGHSPFTTSTESHGPTDSSSAASHVASCDATPPRSAPTITDPGQALTLAAQPISPVQCAASKGIISVAVRSSWHHTSAPLFLLHASFLI